MEVIKMKKIISPVLAAIMIFSSAALFSGCDNDNYPVQVANITINEKPEKNVPVRPNEIRDKLDVDDNVVDAILEYLYSTDLGFRTNVDGYCNEMNLGDINGAELKIKKQILKK